MKKCVTITKILDKVTSRVKSMSKYRMYNNLARNKLCPSESNSD